jgi:hypothetical protein
MGKRRQDVSGLVGEGQLFRDWRRNYEIAADHDKG